MPHVMRLAPAGWKIEHLQVSESEPEEVRKILRHPGCMAEQQPEAATRLVKIGRSPPRLGPASLN